MTQREVPVEGLGPLREAADAVMAHQWSNNREAMDALMRLVDAAHDALDLVAAERERQRAKVRFHLAQTTMSVYATQPECKAARDALQRLLDDEA